MGRQAVQNAVPKGDLGGWGVSNALECFDSRTPYTCINYITAISQEAFCSRKNVSSTGMSNECVYTLWAVGDGLCGLVVRVPGC
jgi:hypothetical protein